MWRIVRRTALCKQRPALSVTALVLLIVAAVPVAADAQGTRAAEIADAQQKKAEAPDTYEPSTAERIATNMKRRFLENPNGFYPWLDSVYSGGGFTLGAGYRRFYGDRTFWDARGLLSVKEYKRAEFATNSVGIGPGRVDLRAVAGWRDATQVAFFGIGNDTRPEAKSNFRLQQVYGAAGLRARGPARLVVDFNISYEDYTLEGGTGPSPSIETVYTPQTAPGLGDDPSFAHATWMAGVDWRPSSGYARRGGLYALTYDSYFDPDDIYTFDRLQAEVVQHVPILRETWVVSLRSVARTTLDDEQTVPYFLLPSLGSGSTLRAYPSWRFRDRHSLLLSGELRWVVNRTFLDMAVFYDAGKVTERREDLNFNELKQDIGLGVRFHGPLTTPLRVEVAHGSEGINVVFSGGAAF
jgi:hypothetical protein